MKAERNPDARGPSGAAWNITSVPRGSPDQEATIAAWIVNLPFSHPYWPTYLFAVIHLRDVPGAPPPYLQYPEAEYEFLIGALNPKGVFDHPLSVEDRESWSILSPINVVVQFDTGQEDDLAVAMCYMAVVEALNGTPVEPDDDARVRPYWTAVIRDTADHARGAHEGFGEAE